MLLIAWKKVKSKKETSVIIGTPGTTITSSKSPIHIGDNANMSPIPTETINSIDDLKSYVYRALCQDHQLLGGNHPTSEYFLRRGSDICGMFFYLQGPRAVRLTAVWDSEGNRVFFYDCNGRRYREMELGDGEIAIGIGNAETKTHFHLTHAEPISL